MFSGVRQFWDSSVVFQQPCDPRYVKLKDHWWTAEGDKDFRAVALTEV